MLTLMLATAFIGFLIIGIGLPAALGGLKGTMVGLEKEFVKDIAFDKAKYISEYMRGVELDVQLLKMFAEQAIAEAPLNGALRRGARSCKCAMV